MRNRKSHTAAMSPEVRQARDHRKAAIRLRELIICVEFYYNNRADYNSKLDSLERAVWNQRVALQHI